MISMAVEGAKNKALLLLGWSAFQSGKGLHKVSPKSDYIQKHFEEVLGIDFDVTLHIESSWKPLVSRYGLHFLESIRRLPSLFLYLLVFFARALVKDGHIFGVGLRGVWSQARLEFWKRHFYRNEYAFVAGLILTNEEIAAARALGIPTIEFQHGVFEDETALWYLNVKPTMIAIWPNQDAVTLRRNGFTTVTLPFPPVGEQNRAKVDRSELLVCLTWGLEDSVDGLGGIPRNLWHQLRTLEASFQNIRFRLHPVFPPGKRRKLEQFLRREYSGANISSRKRSLEEDLDECDTVLIERSSVWLDALRRGLRVFISSSEIFIKAKKFEMSFMSGSELITLLPPEIDKFDSIPVSEASSIDGQSWEEFDSYIRKIVVNPQSD